MEEWRREERGGLEILVSGCGNFQISEKGLLETKAKYVLTDFHGILVAAADTADYLKEVAGKLARAVEKVVDAGIHAKEEFSVCYLPEERIEVTVFEDVNSDGFVTGSRWPLKRYLELFGGER